MTNTAMRVSRRVGQAEEIMTWLDEWRNETRNGVPITANVNRFGMLREFAGIKVDFEEDPNAQFPVPVPGTLIESIGYHEHDGYPAVEITVWGQGTMQVIVVEPHTPVVVNLVESADEL